MEEEIRVLLNVGGIRFETTKSVLKKIPATRLSRLTEALVNYDPATNEYFFDRHPGVFAQILNYYTTGKLHYPKNVCGPLFEEELNFWGLDMKQVEPCCWKTYTKHRNTEETLTTLDRLNIDVEKTSAADLAIKFDIGAYDSETLSPFKRFQPILWQLFEEPRSSKGAKIVAATQISMIAISVLCLWLNSYPWTKYAIVYMKNESDDLNGKGYSIRIEEQKAIYLLDIIDYVTVAWFMFDVTFRFIVSPNKLNFLKEFHNYIDISAIIWFHVSTVIKVYFTHPLVAFIDVIRVLRLLRLLSYHPGLQIIITSLKSSIPVLQLLLIIIGVFSTIYGTLIYYAEKISLEDLENNLFISTVEGLWYSIISLTTIGYGDFSPQSTLGRLFGTACVITGVLMIGLPMTIVVEIFTDFYKHLGARAKLPKQRRRVMPVEAPRLRKKASLHHVKQKQ